MKRSILLGLTICAVFSPAIAAEFVFETAPFRSCHASTLVQLKNGDLLAAWFGGTAEGRPDVAIWASKRTSSGWSVPAELVREPEIAAFNPVLFHTGDENLWLYYKFGLHPTSWSAGRLWSRDEGTTWSKPEHLPAGLYGPIRAKPLVLDDGAIVSGTSVESYRSWSVWIERSTNHGRTWTKFGPIVVDPRYAGGGTPKDTSSPAEWDLTEGIIQPSIVRLGGKRLRLYARSTSRTGKICIADSNDLGITWTQARPIDLPNPNSGIDADTLPDGRVVLVYNHTTKGRTPLNLAISKDGEQFQMFQTLESEPGEYSYPSMIVGRDGALHITYTWNRRRIRYARVPLDQVPR